jgi:TonB-dependent SusC/RagA subfamily outer membrane receptor
MTNGIPHRGIPFFVADDVRYNFSVYDVVRKGMPTSMRQGFDNEKYIELQAANIRKRIAQFGGKLYLEFGGKLFDDYHASRVLPGFEPDTKFRMLESLVDDVEIVIAINANDIETISVLKDAASAAIYGAKAAFAPAVLSGASPAHRHAEPLAAF